MSFHRNNLFVMLVVVVLLGSWIGVAQVQEKPQDAGPAPANPLAQADDPEEAAIRQSAQAFSAAYNSHDAKAVAVLFALKAEFTDEDGNLIKGREAIEQEFLDMFQRFPQCKIAVDVQSIRVLTPHIAIEEGTVHGQPMPDEATNTSTYVAVHVNVDGHWHIASVKDFEESEEPTPHDHLQQLAWMEGNWIDESPDATIKLACRWDESGNYLIGDFFIQVSTGLDASGSMRIGWDPLGGQPKSWTFETDGGTSEGLWTHVGSEWYVKSHGVNHKGDTTSSSNVFRYIDNDTMTWRSYDRVVRGKAAANIPEKVIKRHAPPPKL